MNWLVYLLGGGVALYIALLIISYFLHPTWSGTRSISIGAPLERVWNAVTDISVLSDWRRDIDRVEFEQNDEAGQRWIQYPREGPSSRFVLISKTPMSLYETQMLSNGVLSADWIFKFTDEGDGVKIDVVCTISITKPIYKFMASNIFSSIEQMFDSNMEFYRNDLEQYVTRRKRNQ